jgi:hypothetical protein
VWPDILPACDSECPILPLSQALSGHAASKAQDQCPMTPPRVAGVSMAPVAGHASDFSFPDLAGPSLNPKQQPQRQAGGTETSTGKPAMTLKRPVTLKIAVPGNSGQPVTSEHGLLQVVGRLNAAQGVAEGGPSVSFPAAAQPTPPQPHAPRFMAEGRAVTLTRYSQIPPVADIAEEEEVDEQCSEPPLSPLNHNLAYYREINETDSLWCATLGGSSMKHVV